MFQDLGRAYGIADYEALLGPVKTNEARTKLPAKFPRPDLTRWDDLPANDRLDKRPARCQMAAGGHAPTNRLGTSGLQQPQLFLQHHRSRRTPTRTIPPTGTGKSHGCHRAPPRNRTPLTSIEDEEPLARTWSQQHEITEVAGRLTPDELTDLFGLAAATAYLSDELTDTFGRAAKSARQQALPLVPKTTIEGSEGNKARQAIRQIAHTEFQLSAQLPKIRQWKAKINQLCGWLRTDKSNSALLSRLAYTARLYAVDPDAGIEELKASAKCLKIDPAALSA